jgi:hypothetical protein
MNSKERIDAAVALERPDRVPVAPLLDHFAATYSGITNAELMTDGEKRIRAVLKTMKELGPWDMTFIADTANADLLKFGVPCKLLLPGKELPANSTHQFDERELLTPEDYDLLERVGVFRFLWGLTGRKYPEMKGLRAVSPFISTNMDFRRHARMVRAAGAEIAAGFIHPGLLYDYFSLGRGIPAMSADTFKLQKKLISAGMVWARGMARIAILSAKFCGVPRIFIGMARCSPEFLSPANFEKLVFPGLDYTVREFIAHGITPLLHCDTNWTKFFEIFRRFPEKKCILELDGRSDIFKAKEALGDRMCIMGDVPAALLAAGTRDEVLSYCRRLIQEVGKDGGFILSSGCSVPANARVENVRALMESANEWGRYS